MRGCTVLTVSASWKAHRRPSCVCLLLGALLSTQVAFGQNLASACLPSRLSTDIDSVHVNVATKVDNRAELMRVDVNRVLVPVRVTDSAGRPVLGLDKKDFSVFENGQAQEIRHFSTEDSPLSIGLIVDTSGSMKDKIDILRAAVNQFFVNANPEDDFFAVSVSDRPQVLGDASQSIDEIEKKLGFIRPSGNTALLDAIYLGAMQLKHASYPRRALVIISDGADNNSRYRYNEIKSMLEESDIEVYAIGIFETSLLKSYEEILGKKHLLEVTASTGGRTIAVNTIARVPEAAAQISWDLRNQYVLGYKPPESHDARRKIRVKLTPGADASLLQAHYRRQYFVP
jgi:Ca-activated chloride channel family protein